MDCFQHLLSNSTCAATARRGCVEPNHGFFEALRVYADQLGIKVRRCKSNLVETPVTAPGLLETQI